MPLQYLSNFEGSREMPLINCKVKLKLKWTKYCVLSAVSNENQSDNDNNDNNNDNDNNDNNDNNYYKDT